jgi:hypothetical protein
MLIFRKSAKQFTLTCAINDHDKIVLMGIHEEIIAREDLRQVRTLCEELLKRLKDDGKRLLRLLFEEQRIVPGQYKLSLSDDALLTPIKEHKAGQIVWDIFAIGADLKLQMHS